MTSPDHRSWSVPGGGPKPMPETSAAEERPPMFFWLVVVLATLYLFVRVLQGVAWVVDRVG